MITTRKADSLIKTGEWFSILGDSGTSIKCRLLARDRSKLAFEYEWNNGIILGFIHRNELTIVEEPHQGDSP